MSSPLPEGFEMRRGEGLVYAARPEEAGAMQTMGLDRLSRVRSLLAAGRQIGRGRIAEIAPPEGRPGRALVIKQILHGGLPARLNSRAYAGPGRVLAELDLTIRARQRGVPAPEIPWVAWTRGWPCELFLATVKIPGARNLAQIAAEEPAGPGRAAMGRAAARAVARMHAAGLWHKDLNLRNIVIHGGGTADCPGDAGAVVDLSAAILDLGGSRLQASLGDDRRASNLARLLRSVEKSGLGRNIGRRVRVVFLLAYAGDAWPRYRALRRLIEKQVRWHRLHRLTWSRKEKP